MAERFVIEDGYVGDLAEDLARTQEAVCNNIQKRIYAMVSRTGIQMPSLDSFDIESVVCSPAGHSEYTIKVSLHKLAMVLFPDYVACDPDTLITSGEDPEISGDMRTSTIPVNVFVVLTRSPEYTNPGVWRPGYPEDSPDQGENTMATLQMSLMLSLEPINDATHITLYELSVSGFTYEVLEDFRMVRSLALRSTPGRPKPDKVSGLTLQSISQAGVLHDSASLGQHVFNTQSPHTNLYVNSFMMLVAWPTVGGDNNIWAYDLKVQPLSGATQVPIGSMPLRYLIAANPGEEFHEALVPAAEGVKYEVSVRAIDVHFPRIPGDWSDPQALIVGTDLVEDTPKAPSLTVAKLYESPPIYSVNVEVIEDPPKPFFVQVFRRNASGQSAPIGSGTLVYEGDAMNVRLIAGQGESPEFCARVVAPGGVCSPTTEWVAPYQDAGGYGNLYFAEKLQVAVPIIAKIVVDNASRSSGYSYCAEFYPPAPGCRITDMSFVSAGSYLHYTTPSNPDVPTRDFWIQVEPSSYGIESDYTAGSIPNSHKGRLFLGYSQLGQVDLYHYYSDGHGGGPWGDFASIAMDNYHRFWETAGSGDNFVPTNVFSPDEKMRVIIRYDNEASYATSNDYMMIITGTLFLTLTMAEE